MVVIRSISDGPLAPIPFDMGEFMDENSNLRMGKLALEVLKNPRLVKLGRRMIRNNQIAARNAANAVLSALGEL